MNKDEHYQRLTQIFGEYLEAYQNYNNEREGDFDKFMVLERKIHDVLGDSVLALGIEFRPDPEYKDEDSFLLDNLLEASSSPYSEEDR